MSPLAALSPRQREVAELLIAGRTNGEIASMLEITQKTVDTHRHAILKTLKVRSNVMLVRLAYGLDRLDQPPTEGQTT